MSLAFRYLRKNLLRRALRQRKIPFYKSLSKTRCLTQYMK